MAEVNPNDMNVHLGLALAYEYFDEFEKAAQKYDLLLGMVDQIEDEKEQEAVRRKIEELKENAQNRKRNDVAIISREIKESQSQTGSIQPPVSGAENSLSPSSEENAVEKPKEGEGVAPEEEENSEEAELDEETEPEQENQSQPEEATQENGADGEVVTP